MKKLIITILVLFFTGCINSTFADIYYAGENFERFLQYGKYGVRTVPQNENENSQVVVRPVYDSLSYIEYGLFIAKKNDKYGVIDIDGHIIVSIEWDDLSLFGANQYKVERNSKFGLFDSYGIRLTEVIYDDLKYLDSYKSIYQRNNRYGLLDYKYQEVTEPIFTSYINLDKFYIGVADEIGWGIYSYEGEEIIPMVNNWVPVRSSNIPEGLLLVKENGNYGLMSVDNKIVLAPKYPLFHKFEDYGVVIKLKAGGENYIGVVDISTGKYIVQTIYEKIQYLDKYGYFKVKKNGKWGAINSQGKIVYPCQYGPLEINKIVKKIPVDNAGLASIEKNKTLYQYYKALYYLEISYFSKAKSIIKKLFESSDSFAKEKAEILMYQYNFDPYM